MRYSKADIGIELAQRAHDGTSWSPEQRGESVVSGYVAEMAAIEREFEAWRTEENSDALDEDLERYRAKYVELERAYLHSHSRIISSFIAGPSGFPVRQMEKRNDACDKHRDEWLKFSEEALERLRRKYDPERIAHAPIKADDEDAPERLRAKIEKAKASQEAYKQVNAICRRKLTDDEKRAELAALGIGEQAASEILKPDYAGKQRIPAWMLSNNLANIKRMEGRLAEIERQRAQDQERGNACRMYPFDGGVVIDDPLENRYKIKHDAKPERAIIDDLKARGFHWTPTLKLWQRQRTPDAWHAVKAITGIEIR